MLTQLTVNTELSILTQIVVGYELLLIYSDLLPSPVGM